MKFENTGTLTVRASEDTTRGPDGKTQGLLASMVRGTISGYKEVNLIKFGSVTAVDNSYEDTEIGFSTWCDAATLNLKEGYAKGDCRECGRGVSVMVLGVKHVNKVNISGYGVVRGYEGTTGDDTITVKARSFAWLGSNDGSGTVDFSTGKNVLSLSYDHKDDVDGNTGKYYLESSSQDGDVYISLSGGPNLTFVSETGGGESENAIIYTSKSSSPSKIVYTLSEESAKIYGPEMVIRIGKLVPDPDDDYINVSALSEFTCVDEIRGLNKISGTGIVNLSYKAYASIKETHVTYSKMGWDSDDNPTEGIDIYNIGYSEDVFGKFDTWAVENLDDTQETAKAVPLMFDEEGKIEVTGWLYGETGRVMNDQNDWYSFSGVKQGTAFNVKWEDGGGIGSISLLHSDGTVVNGTVADADGDYYLHISIGGTGMAAGYTATVTRPLK